MTLERLNAEAGDLTHALSLFQSYMSQMVDEYDKRNLSAKNQMLEKACTKLTKDCQILKKAVLIMDGRLKENTQDLKK